MDEMMKPPSVDILYLENSWKCECGIYNTGNYCTQCGKPKPVVKPKEHWMCPNCSTDNTSVFCSNCGTMNPAKAEDFEK